MSGLEGVFDWGLATSWQVALLVLAVLALQRLCRRWLSPRGRYALWLLVMIRLALPAVPELPVGLVDWSRAHETASAAVERSALPGLARVERRPAGTPARAEVPAPEPEVPATSRERPPARLALAPVARRAEAKEPAPAPPRWKPLAAAAWLLVALALFARAALQELAFRRRLRAAEPLDAPELVAAGERCRRELGLRRAVPLLRVDELHAPAVHGWLRPRVLLPSSALERLDAAGLERVLRHELAHVRHHNVALGAFVCALRCLWWFHPLVHLATLRLRAAQEALRDWEAVRSEGSPAPLAYARTLLALATKETAPTPPGALAFLRRGKDTQERILMIADFRRPGFAAGALATLLVTTLGLASLTSARAVPRLAPPGDGAADELRHVEVERSRQTPAWREAIERQLHQASVGFDCEDCSLGEVLEFLRQVSGVNIVVAPDVLGDHADLEFTFRLPETSVAEILRFVCDATEALDYCYLREAVYVGQRGDIPESLELRFYKIAPMLESAPADERDSLLWELVDQVQQLTGGYGEWESDGVAIEAWDDVLVVNQTEAVHARVQAMLDRFLNRGAEPPQSTPAWETALHETLTQPAQLDFEDRPVEDALAYLSSKHGVSIELEEGLEPDPITLSLDGVSLGTALDWIAALTDRHVDLRRQGVVLTELSPKELRFYEVGDLFGPTWDLHDGELRDRVDSAIRNTVDPDSWDDDWRSLITFWGELMIVVQSKEAHAQITALLETVRRATAKG